MSRVWRVGLVGCGGMGRHHLDTVRSLPDFEAVALADVAPETLAQVGETYGVGEGSRFTDFEVMYEQIGLDLVVVATQTRQHCSPSVAALERGISVLCEKPIAIDLAEADAMVEAAARSGAKLAICQQNHVNPGILRAREMVAAGDIGEVVLVRGRNKCGRKSANEFTEMGTHVTDMMLCFGGQPEWVAGTVYWEGRSVGAEDIVEAKEMSPGDRDSGLVAGQRAIGSYGFVGGVLGEIHFLGYEKNNSRNYGVDVLGTEGQLAVRATTGLGENLWHLPHPMEGTPADLGDWLPVDLGERAGDDPISTMYAELVRAAEGDVEPPGSGVEGRWAFEMILGIYQSHREGGGRVDLPLADRRHPLERWQREAGMA